MPSGFEWGYGGSGPAQLALAILLEFTDEQTAQNLYQQFKWDHIANLAQEQDWMIAEWQITGWIDRTERDYL